MNTLEETKDDLKAALTTAGLWVHTFAPQPLHPPMVVLQAGAPYVQMNATNKTFTNEGLVSIECVLIVGLGTNEKEIADMDDMVCTALGALYGLQLNSVTVGDYYAVPDGDAEYLALNVDITAWVNF